MEHLRIWIQIITVIAGTGVVISLLQLSKRHPYPFLRLMFWCLVLLNVSFVVGLLSEYLLVNFFRDVMALKTSLFIEVIDPLSSLVFLGLVYFLFSLHSSFDGTQPRAYLVWIAFGAGAVVAANTLLGILITNGALILKVFSGANIVILTVAFVGACVILGYLAFGRINHLRQDARTGVRVLGLFYLTGCAVVLLSAVFGGAYHGLLKSLICLSFTVFPVWWLRRYLPAFGNGLADSIDVTDLAAFLQQHGVSNRQGEIIRLILEGKSNRDIAEALFIAPHTVKNHIYSLYQKLHVKSRYELVSLVLGRITH
jgi:DNA-binding CsgD family transcriptional regulator